MAKCIPGQYLHDKNEAWLTPRANCAFATVPSFQYATFAKGCSVNGIVLVGMTHKLLDDLFGISHHISSSHSDTTV